MHADDPWKEDFRYFWIWEIWENQISFPVAAVEFSGSCNCGLGRVYNSIKLEGLQLTKPKSSKLTTYRVFIARSICKAT